MVNNIICLDGLSVAIAEIYNSLKFDVLPPERGGTGCVTYADYRSIIMGTSTQIIDDNWNVMLKKYAEKMTGHNNIKIGNNSGSNITSTDNNIIIGSAAASSATVATGSTFIGAHSGTGGAKLEYSTYIGFGAGMSTVGDGSHNVYIGAWAGQYLKDSKFNVCIGVNAGQGSNEAIGVYTGTTIIGYGSGMVSTNLHERSNVTIIGAWADATGNAQVQLGQTGTDVYGGTYNTRSDERDKANITDLEYDYTSFIMGLRPVNFQWDYRDDYRDPEHPISLTNITHDGSHVRNRRHNGFIAQEVKALMDSLGFDFAGYQDHSVNWRG